MPDILGLIVALVKFFQDNYLTILSLADRLGQLIVDIYALALALAAILEKYLKSQRAGALKKAMLAPFKK